MIKRILIIKMWALGDIIMATPLLNALKAADPDIKIDWFVDSTHADAIIAHPMIENVIVMDTNAWRKQLKRGNVFAWVGTTWSYMRRLNKANYDAIINCHPDKWWTALFSQGKTRVALYPFDVDSLSRVFYSKSIPRPRNPGIHNTVHYLLATRYLGFPDGGLQLSVAPAKTEIGSEDLEQIGPAQRGRPCVFIAPFCTADNRNWPVERYRLLIDWLIDVYDADITVSGSGRDQSRAVELVETVQSDHVHPAIGTTVDRFIELIRNSDLVICSDSSPMHIAAAVDVPYLALFGATPVSERAPLAGVGIPVYHPIECSPCDSAVCTNSEFRACMTSITVDEAKAAVTTLLNRADR